MLLNLPQPAVSAPWPRGFSGTYTGGLGLINSPAYPHKDWQELNWKDYSPRVGFAYSPTNKWVFRGGFGMSYLPAEAIAFGLGPYDSPLNLATTTITSSWCDPDHLADQSVPERHCNSISRSALPCRPTSMACLAREFRVHCRFIKMHTRCNGILDSRGSSAVRRRSMWVMWDREATTIPLFSVNRRPVAGSI